MANSYSFSSSSLPFCKNLHNKLNYTATADSFVFVHIDVQNILSLLGMVFPSLLQYCASEIILWNPPYNTVPVKQRTGGSGTHRWLLLSSGLVPGFAVLSGLALLQTLWCLHALTLPLPLPPHFWKACLRPPSNFFFSVSPIWKRIVFSRWYLSQIVKQKGATLVCNAPAALKGKHPPK